MSRRQGVIFQVIVFKEDIVVQESEVLEFVIKNGGQAKSSQRMEDDSSLERFSKRYQECSRRMEDEEQRGRSSRIPEDEHRKRDYSLRMENGS